MSGLDRLLPAPRLVEIDRVDVSADAERVWEFVRHGALPQPFLVRALFALRELPDRLAGRPTEPFGRLEDLRSTPDRPGFQILVDDPPTEVVIGAIGQVWKPEIPFVHVEDAAEFAAYVDPGEVKVAWAVQVSRRAPGVTRVELELRVDATDDASWNRFRTYFRLIGPGSRFVRRSLLAGLARDVEGSRRGDDARPLAGDDLLPDANDQLTDGVTVEATPREIWPWLVQMGSRRAGFYSIDLLDNAGRRSAREIHPAMQTINVGDVLSAAPGATDGFEVLRIDEAKSLVLGRLHDVSAGRQVPFGAPRPVRFAHLTWAFELEPIDERRTRLIARVRVAASPDQRGKLRWLAPAHRLMERAQLRNLAARAEGRVRKDDWRDALESVGGAAAVVGALLTPQRRAERTHWGLSQAEAERTYPGDDLVTNPRWSWTHAVDIDAPAARVWPWVAQIGADRAGFYSYQWLENAFGSDLVNAERVHPEWEARVGDELVIYPGLPALSIDRLEPGRWFVASTKSSHVEVSWLFLIEPTDDVHCRFISRYRCRTSEEFGARLRYGPWLAEPLGFAMDRRMLLGVKERAEGAARPPSSMSG